LVAIISISFGILLPTSTAYSQSYLRINDDIGGGGGTATQNDNSDNTTLYIVGAALVVGVIAYIVISKKMNKEKEIESDTTSALNNFYNYNLGTDLNDYEHTVEKIKDSIPVDLIFGVRNERSFISEKTYLMGVSVRF
jgi:hypothetical protein